MPKFEYKFLHVQFEEPLETDYSPSVFSVDGKKLEEAAPLQDYLNHLGNVGWEIINIAPSDYFEFHKIIFLKRKISD